MFAFVLILIIRNEAGFISINCSGAVPWIELIADLRSNADNGRSFGFFESRVIQGIVMAGEDTILSDFGWVGLN